MKSHFLRHCWLNMNRFSFVFSLLLIVSVTTTFASVIKAKNPTKEELEGLRSDPESSPYHEMPRNSKKIETLQSDAGLGHYPEMVPNRKGLEALLKRSHGPKSLRDQDSEMPKFKDVPEEAEVIPGHELTPARLEKFLDSLPSAAGHVVAIGIDNESGFTWSKLSTYFYSGTEDKNLPYHLNHESAVLYGALSTESEPAAIGVLAYYIPSIGKTLGVMWSNPYVDPNTWNIGLYDGEVTPDFDIYRDLKDHHAMGPGETGEGGVTLGSGLKFTGRLSGNGYRVTLKIQVKPDIVAFRKPASMHN